MKKDCLIHVNNLNLINFLESNGYVMSKYHTTGDCIFTNTNILQNIKTFGLIPESRVPYYTLEEHGVLNGRIDCGNNEQLFKSTIKIINEK